jgi:hypothetical protein
VVTAGTEPIYSASLFQGFLYTLTFLSGWPSQPRRQDGRGCYFLVSSPTTSLTSHDLRSGGCENSHLDEFNLTTGHNAFKPTDLISSKISLKTWAHSAC